MKRFLSVLAAMATVVAGLVFVAPSASATTITTAVLDCSTIANGATVYAPALAAGDDLTISFNKCQHFTFTPTSGVFTAAAAYGPEGSNGPGSTTTFAGYVTGSTLAVVSYGATSFTLKTAIHALADKVTICHRTHSLTNPYVLITVAVSSVINNSGGSVGHGNHNSDSRHPSSPTGIFDPGYSYPSNAKFWGDIIPPFIDNATGQVFVGLNWAYSDPVSVTGPGSSGLWIEDTQFTNAVTAGDRTDPTKGISYCLDNTRNTLSQKQLFNLEVKNGQDPADVVSEFTDLYDRTGGSATVTPAATLADVETVVTDAPTGITTTQATLNGTLKAGTSWTGWYFQWTGSNPYGPLTDTATTSFAPTPGALNESFPLTGLSCGTTYNYRIVGLDNSTPAVSYYGGFVSFTTSACPSGGGGASAPAPTPTPELPTPIAAKDDAYTTPYNTPLTVPASGVLGNDSGAGLRVIGNTQPKNGTVSMNPDGSFTYSPNPGFSGVDEFDYDIADATGQTASAKVRITVPAPPAGTPTTSDDAFVGPFDTPILGAVTGNDTFPTGSTYTARTQPKRGTLVMNPDGTFTYTPDPGFSGTDSFTYVACEPAPNQSVCSMSTVTLTIKPPATTPGPITDPDLITLPAGSAGPATFTPIPLGTPSKGSAFNGTIQLAPQGGSQWDGDITIPGQGTWKLSGGRVLFTPFPGFVGSSTIQYRIQDGTGRWATSTLTAIRPAVPGASPLAPPYEDALPAGSMNPVPFSPILGATPSLGSKFKAGSLAIAPTRASGWGNEVAVPGKGTFQIVGDQVIFTPAPGFTGTAQCRYRVQDETGQWAWNTITVTTPPLPGASPVLLPTSKMVQRGSTKKIVVPVDRIATPAIGSSFDPGSVAIAPLRSKVWRGQVLVPGKGRFQARPGRVVFTPAKNFTGVAVVKVRIAQKNGQFVTSTLTVTGPRAGALNTVLAGS